MIELLVKDQCPGIILRKLAYLSSLVSTLASDVIPATEHAMFSFNW